MQRGGSRFGEWLAFELLKGNPRLDEAVPVNPGFVSFVTTVSSARCVVVGYSNYIFELVYYSARVALGLYLKLTCNL